jgi:hypothetical protein
MLHPISKTVNIKGVLLSIFLGSFLLVGCKTQEVQTNWSSEPVKVDGKMDDWANTPMLYFEESGVQLGLRNDNVNLYILFRFNNEAWLRAIRMGGLTLWINNSGSKKKALGIRYTGGPSFFDFQKMRSSDEGGFQEAMTPEQRQRFHNREEKATDQLTIIDKINNQERSLPAIGLGGPAVSYDSSQGGYTYEFSLPLQKSDSSEFGIGAQSGQTICLGIEWGGMSMGKGQHQRPDRSGSGGEGEPEMGGRQTGGRGRGGWGGGRGERPGGSSDSQSSEKQELWIKIKLAVSSAK